MYVPIYPPLFSAMRSATVDEGRVTLTLPTGRFEVPFETVNRMFTAFKAQGWTVTYAEGMNPVTLAHPGARGLWSELLATRVYDDGKHTKEPYQLEPRFVEALVAVFEEDPGPDVMVLCSGHTKLITALRYSASIPCVEVLERDDRSYRALCGKHMLPRNQIHRNHLETAVPKPFSRVIIDPPEEHLYPYWLLAKKWVAPGGKLFTLVPADAVTGETNRFRKFRECTEQDTAIPVLLHSKGPIDPDNPRLGTCKYSQITHYIVVTEVPCQRKTGKQSQQK